ncbi:MAG TPA: FAD-dependent oxidoreductase, partial [Coxiellaceae bacterium]|nr:FAD-dependent oxidoreductase [Coxiellaceae bacterium]
EQGEEIVKAKAVVNTAGAWSPSVLTQLFGLENKEAVSLIKGSHIIVPKIYPERVAYTLQNSDGRVVFVIPYKEHFSLIGTTDVATDSPSKPKITNEEITYLIKATNAYFKKQINAKDIMGSYAGLRCLAGDNKIRPSEITRDNRIQVDLVDDAPLVSLFGGKLTTHRAVAAEIVKKLEVYFPPMNKKSTRNLILPGGDLNKSFDAFVAQLREQYPWVPVDLIARYAHNYGSLSYKILNNCHSLADLGKHFGAGLYQREVDYLLKEEWLNSVDDLLWRRTKLGLEAQAINLKDLTAYLEGNKNAHT